jgi:large subunit ribosomal protein L29
MANGRAAEVRDLTDEELLGRLREAKEELFNLRFQVATGQLDNNRRLHTVRRDIARIYTVMRERELGIVRAGTETDDTAAAGTGGAT